MPGRGVGTLRCPLWAPMVMVMVMVSNGPPLARSAVLRAIGRPRARGMRFRCKSRVIAEVGWRFLNLRDLNTVELDGKPRTRCTKSKQDAAGHLLQTHAG